LTANSPQKEKVVAAQVDASDLYARKAKSWAPEVATGKEGFDREKANPDPSDA
jgi:hypothetical protein